MNFNYVDHEEVVTSEQGGQKLSISSLKQFERKEKRAAFQRPSAENDTKEEKKEGTTLGIAGEDLQHLQQAFEIDPDWKPTVDKIMGATKAPGTISGYNTVVNDFKSFCKEKNYKDLNVTEAAMGHF